MTCWDVLDVPSDSDRSAIRKAYARLIKQFRPDESPKEFQDINAAYEEALHRLRYPYLYDDSDAEGLEVEGDENSEREGADYEEVPEEFFPPGMTKEIFANIDEAIKNLPENEMIVEVDGFRLTRGENPEDGFAIEKLFDPDNDTFRENLDAGSRVELDRLLGELERIFETEDAANPRHWEFLSSCDRLLDAEFRYQLTGELLRNIAHYNLARSAAQAPIGIVAMSCLDRYLNFSDASCSDYHQISEREWHALRMPHRMKNVFSSGEAGSFGVKGGKFKRNGKGGGSDAINREFIEVDTLKFVFSCGWVALLIFGSIAIVKNGFSEFIFVLALFAAILFGLVLSNIENEK
uniref:J domain-containing protein n=1 Tax=Microbulbifer agarilyticus TaxID=260552 RepID=UPI0002558A82|nr:J domain-containing protein [Microbulbifer agarilyticus]